jgi:hypothetical protein
MDPIRPIEPRSRWEAPLAPPARERREPSDREQPSSQERGRQPHPQEPAGAQGGPDEGPSAGRHVDVRA